MSSRFFRLLLLCCLANGLSLFSFAQSVLLSESELDTTRVWFNAGKPKQPEPGNYSGVYLYETFSELADRVKSGKQIHSIDISGIARDVENLAKCRELQSVRITLHPGREGYLDSVLTQLKGLPVQHLAIEYLHSWTTGRKAGDNTRHLPAAIKELRYLKKITLNARDVDWQQATDVLADIPTLKTLRITPKYGNDSFDREAVKIDGLGRLRQLSKLIIELSDQTRIAPELAKLNQLSTLVIVDRGAKPDEYSQQLAEVIKQLTNLETLDASMRILNNGEAVTNLRKLRKLTINGYFTREKLTIDSPVDLRALNDLEELSIDGANLTSWPEGICTMPRLKSLSLRSNKLSGVPACLGNLKQLERLMLQENRLSGSLAPIGALSKLQTLNLSSCQLDSLADMFGKLSELKYLNLEQNQLKVLPGSIGRLSGLMYLNLSGNQLLRLPAFINVSGLVQVSVGRNKLTEIPAGISKAVSLTSLMAGGNDLVQLPDQLAECKHIQVLDLSSNKLTQLPVWLGNLKRLKRLNLSSNALTTLPEGISQLDSLVMLGIAENRITKLPERVSHWKTLKELGIYKNPIQVLPEDIGSLSQLTNLTIQDNPIQSLPASIGNMTELRNLTLSGTKVRFLPDELGKLKKLRSLMLMDNELMALPDQLGGCSELATLVVNENKLTGLPNGIGRLKKLKMLSVRGQDKDAAQLEIIPDSIAGCIELEQVILMNLPALNADEAFRNLIKLPKLSGLTMYGTTLAKLPETDWATVRVQRLQLNNNAVSVIPAALLDAPNLYLIDLRENPLPKQLETTFTSKDQLRIALAETGQIRLDASGKKDWPLANGFMQSAMRKAGQRDWTGAEGDMAKAIDLAPDSVIAILSAQRAEFFFFRKQFGEAVAEFDKALKMLPLLTQNSNTFRMGGMRVTPNRTLKAFWLIRKSMALGRTSQFDAARASAELAAQEVPEIEKIKPEDALTTGMIYTELGRFQLQTNQHKQAINAFKNAVAAYEKSLLLEAGTRLTMVEISLITGQYDRAAAFLQAMPDYQRSGGYVLLHEYLRLATAVLTGKESPEKAEEALALFIKAKGGQITGWNYNLFETWLHGAGLPENQAAGLKRLTILVKERSISEN